MIYKTLHIKLKVEHHELHKNRWWTMLLCKGKQYVIYIKDEKYKPEINKPAYSSSQIMSIMKR